ncbi:MAG TPA: carboxylate-amine ligase [Anaerolineae bacterium]|nr:carboxylate-amine ligase [Anaerolineae bacterium]
MRDPSLTIGIEEEYQIVDPVDGKLRSFITQSLEEDHRVLREFVYEPKMRQSVIEIGTKICRTPTEASEELVKIRRGVAELAARNGLRIVAAGTHPFYAPGDSPARPGRESFMGVKQNERDQAIKHLSFSTHVHITVEDRDFLIDAMNVARYLLPHMLVLSTSSPFWQGYDSGLKSYRSIYQRNFPRTGIPRVFSSWSDYTQLADTLIRTNCMRDGRDIWWDLRPNWEYPTLEFRICDVCTRVEEAVCIAAIFQAIVAKLWKLRHDNMTFRVYPHDLIEENKWRAARFGLDGRLIDFGKQKELPARELIAEMVSWFIDDVVDDLGSREHVNYAFKIMDDGTSADRQLATLRRTGSMQAVVQQLIEETNDLPEPKTS